MYDKRLVRTLVSRAFVLPVLLFVGGAVDPGLAPQVVSANTPANVSIWLGTWTTRFGPIFFYDVYREKSDYPGPDGKPQYFWALKGFWNRNGKHEEAIHGALSNKDPGTYQGCWIPPKESSSSSCATMLIFRYNTELRGGYWKPCGLGENCKAHMDWRGQKTSGAWKVHFAFTQRGYPDGHHVIKTTIGGAGALVYETSHLNGATFATHGSEVFLVDLIPEASDLHITLAALTGYVQEEHHRATVNFLAVVTKSDDHRCPRGSGVYVTVQDGRSGVPDQINVRPANGKCDGRQEETWTSTDPSRVRVTISGPTETK